ncbi:hypothetical protein C2G38_2055702, partial [Gigaspora rosea]
MVKRLRSVGALTFSNVIMPPYIYLYFNKIMFKIFVEFKNIQILIEKYYNLIM